MTSSTASTDSRSILVSGANKGIGYEAVKHLSQRLPSSTILLGTRSVQNGEEAVKKMKSSTPDHSFENVKVIQLDISDKASLSKAVETVRARYGGKLDVLLHNSGISNVDGDWNSREVLDVNVVGAKDCVEAFLPLLPAKSGTVVLVSSEVGAWYMNDLATNPASYDLHKSLDDPAQNDWRRIETLLEDWVAFSKKDKADQAWPANDQPLTTAYSASKTLISAWTRNFAKTHSDVKVAVVCPGYCATELTGNQGFRPASAGGESVVWPIVNDFETGHFYQDGKDPSFTFAMPEHYKQSFSQ